MKWHDNPGRTLTWPGTTLVYVIWANGREALRPYEVRQLVWEKRGWEHDIETFRRA